MAYSPILSIRPSEILALSELPDACKDLMQPIVLLKPWLGKGALSRGIDKFTNNFGSRPWFAELDPLFMPNGDEQVLEEYARIRAVADGYNNWIDYVRELDGAIPVLQLVGIQDVALFQLQAMSAFELGRGVAVRLLQSEGLPFEQYINALPDELGDDLTVIMDYEQINQNIFTKIHEATSRIMWLRKRFPEATIIVSASSFPFSFDRVVDQDIYERMFFNALNAQIPNLTYSDRGSARAIEQGGGGIPRPRIDLPSKDKWHFYRSDLVREEKESDEQFKQRRLRAYEDLAAQVIHSENWDNSVNIWGTQLIKITQLDATYGINSPAKATACRINLHLAQQALYGTALETLEFEEDWVD